jgi:molybdopterin-containing oxidoreductase family iron-sulfur binding subunit
MHHVHDGIADTDSAWTDSLREGFFQKPENAVKAVVTATSYAFGGAATFEGSGEFYLRAFPHAFLQDGRYANQPWAQEAPDPQTGNVWDTWVEMHPDTADKLGVARNSEVEITSPHGTIKIGVHAQRGVRKDTVAIAFGNGHTANGRYSDGYGVNVVDLLGLARTANGGLAWQQAKVTVKATGQQADLVTTYSPYGTTDEQRGFAYPVNADALGKAGDDAREHPGDLIGIHHLPRDPRLIKADITNFYELPEHPVYRWGMTIDTNACNGCGACVVACYAENNLPVVGKAKVAEGREMGWVRINRYTSEHDGNEEVTFVPMMCQHCGHAGCESVCPVLATYHTIEGLNAMVYNRCVGTRYCSNACPFSVRRFNYHSYVWPEPFNLLLNPDVSTRTMGVMEKCTFCVQRIREMKSAYRDEGFDKTIPEEAMSQLTACAEACPSQAMVFGNLNDPNSGPSKLRNSGRSYYPLVELNVFPAINYMAKASFHVEEAGHHGGGHGDAAHGAGHDDGHAEDPAHADEHGHEKEAADEHHAEEPSHPASHDADGH